MLERLSQRSSVLPYLGMLWVVQLVLIAYYLSSALPAGGVPFDDAWIHFVFARNLAEFGEVSFNPGQWSGGTTSLLWDLLLALGYRLSGHMLMTAYVLGMVCYLLAATALFFLLASAFGQTAEGRGLALVAAIGFAAIGFVPYLALSGMDTLLFLTLALGSLAAFVHGYYRLVGWLLAALVITRIEGLGVLLLLGLAVLVDSRHLQRWQPFLRIIVPPALMLALYLLFNWRTAGHLLPTTMAGRKWLWQLPEGWWAFSLERTKRFLYDWRNLIAHFILADKRVSVYFLGGLMTIGLTKMVVGAVCRRLNGLGVVLLVAWVLEHNLAYLFLAPLASWRHQAPNLVLLPTLATVGIRALSQWSRRPLYHQLVTALCGLAMLICLLPGTAAYRQTFANNVIHINHVHVAAGRWIDAHLPTDAVVAAFDIGAIRYFGNRWTLDLGGLTDVYFVHRYLYPGRVAKYLRERNATHLAMPEPAQHGQTNIGKRLGIEDPEAQLHFRPLVTFEIPPYIRPPFTSLPYQFYPAYLKITIYEIEHVP